MKLGLGCLFAFIFFIFFFILSAIGTLARVLFSFKNKKFGNTSERRTEQQTRQTNYKKQEKIFEKNEGEYIDFEEIK